MNTNSLLALACAALLPALSGCGPASGPAPASNTNASQPAPAAKRGTVGVSLLTLRNPFFKVIGDHITSELAQHGYETLVLSADEDPAKQANQVKDFIVKKAVAIVLSP